MDSSNFFIVHLDRDGSKVVVKGYEWLDQPITPEEALNLAAWLVAVTDPKQEEFRRVLSEVLKS
jgi:hypothetical protein